jgi:hypothetical protein
MFPPNVWPSRGSGQPFGLSAFWVDSMRAPVTISSEAEPEIAIGRFEPYFGDAPRGRDRRLDRSEITLIRRSKHEDEPFHQRPANVELRSWPLQAPSTQSYRQSSPRRLVRTGDNVEPFLPKAPRRLPFRLSHLRIRPAGRGVGHWRRKFSPCRLQRQFLALGRKRPFQNFRRRAWRGASLAPRLWLGLCPALCRPSCAT